MRLHLWAVLLCLCLAPAAVWSAIPSPCTACEAVANELQRKLDAERPRNHLDMRHRLDKDGKRYGKVIAYKMSELRAVELLEDLCEGMDQYTLHTNTSEGSDPVQRWVKYKGAGAETGLEWPPAGEREGLSKHLTAFCGMLLERHEDEVVAALQTDAFSTPAGVAPVLCQQISSKCRGKVYSREEGSSSSADGVEAAPEGLGAATEEDAAQQEL